MRSTRVWMIVALAATVPPLAACEQSVAQGKEAARVAPAAAGANEGAAFTRVRLTEKAAKRLDLQTAAVSEKKNGTAVQKVVPYSAVLYDTHGDTWVYTSPEPLVFVRTRITVDRVDGDQAILTEGPASGTSVVTTGAIHLSGGGGAR